MPNWYAVFIFASLGIVFSEGSDKAICLSVQEPNSRAVIHHLLEYPRMTAEHLTNTGMDLRTIQLSDNTNATLQKLHK